METCCSLSLTVASRFAILACAAESSLRRNSALVSSLEVGRVFPLVFLELDFTEEVFGREEFRVLDEVDDL